ncbi:MAG: PA0069 family radical SAM protein [Gemmatimonadota bacterium]
MHSLPPIPPPTPRGRATGQNTANRFERLALELDPVAPEDGDSPRPTPTEFYLDHSKSILAGNDSSDLGFRFSVNPYRGCEHGCIYCYARPSHEYLGFSAGLDFETRILVKERAPELLAASFRRPSWQPQVVALSGNTDCYQPVERRLQLTRRCLQVFLDFRNPVTITTKNHLITRDLDLLRDLATLDLVHTTVSVTTLRPDLAAVMEPRTARPQRRLDAIEQLASAGVPVSVNVAPLIPGLNDEELPAILAAAAARGATDAGYLLVRLPGAVEPLFVDWLQRTFPDRAGKVLNRLRAMRGGQLSDNRIGRRFHGQGELADLMASVFGLARRRGGFPGLRPLCTTHFRRTAPGQLSLL